MYILGIGGLLGHDANVALFKDSILISASQEERYTDKKHDADFPINSIMDCLNAAHIDAKEIDVCIFAEKPFYQSAFNYTNKQPNFIVNTIGKLSHHFEKTIYESKARKIFPNASFRFSWHHASHVIAGFHSSGFKESAFLCVDGKSENANASIGYINERTYEFSRELKYDNGLGMLYTFITHFLGFKSFGSEYKVMGLAPYGEPTFIKELYTLINTDENGCLRMKFNPSFHSEKTLNFFHLVENATGVKAATADILLTQDQVNIATTLQKIFEIEVVKMAKYAKSLYPHINNIIFCGGCAQNCVSAGVLRDSGIFDKVFNSPIGGDMGSAVGACIDYIRLNKGSQPFLFKNDFYFGSKAGKITISQAQVYEMELTKDIYTTTAQLLAEGNICGWIQDGMELGARALGARSILANPLDPEMQSKMNLKIKFRESFRPFAPIILEEEQTNWFDTAEPSYYMQYTAFLRKDLRYEISPELSGFKERLNYPRCEVPSIVHVDFSARLQTIAQDVHPKLHHLLTAFNQITGVPILINTSFNVNGQPIVRTADDAWNCFIHTDIDYLIVGEKLYKRPDHITFNEKLAWRNRFSKYSK